MIKWLTFNEGRTNQWQEHEEFPRKAVLDWFKYRDPNAKMARHRARLYVYMLSVDREWIDCVPENEWERYL